MVRRYVDAVPPETERQPLVPLPGRVMINPAYRIEDEGVFDIVAAHPEVAALLDEIVIRTPQYFPEATGLVIKSQADPDDGSLSWYVEIETPVTAEVVISQLKRFDREWWLAGKADVNPEFVVTVILV